MGVEADEENKSKNKVVLRPCLNYGMDFSKTPFTVYVEKMFSLRVCHLNLKGLLLDSRQTNK